MALNLMVRPQDPKSVEEIYEIVTNDHHRHKPCRGDVWIERVSIVVMVVLEIRVDGSVIVVTDKKRHPDHTYSMDLTKAKRWSSRNFCQYPVYGSGMAVSINGVEYMKCWAHVTPRGQRQIADEWDEYKETMAEDHKAKLLELDGVPAPKEADTSVRSNYR